MKIKSDSVKNIAYEPGIGQIGDAKSERGHLRNQ